MPKKKTSKVKQSSGSDRQPKSRPDDIDVEAPTSKGDAEGQPSPNNQATYKATAVELSKIYNAIPDGWRDGQNADNRTLSLLAPFLLTRWRITLPNNESAVVRIEGCLLKISESISRKFPDYLRHHLLSFRRTRPSLSPAEAEPRSHFHCRIVKVEALFQNNLNLRDNKLYTFEDWCDNSDTPSTEANSTKGNTEAKGPGRNPQRKAPAAKDDENVWLKILDEWKDHHSNAGDYNSQPITQENLADKVGIARRQIVEAMKAHDKDWSWYKDECGNPHFLDVLERLIDPMQLANDLLRRSGQ